MIRVFCRPQSGLLENKTHALQKVTGVPPSYYPQPLRGCSFPLACGRGIKDEVYSAVSPHPTLPQRGREKRTLSRIPQRHSDQQRTAGLARDPIDSLRRWSTLCELAPVSHTCQFFFIGPGTAGAAN